MTEQNYDKLLDASVDELPKELQPPRDLWAGIDHAIEMRANDRKMHTRKFLQVAAVLALVVGATWGFYTDFSSNISTPKEAIMGVRSSASKSSIRLQLTLTTSPTSPKSTKPLFSNFIGARFFASSNSAEAP